MANKLCLVSPVPESVNHYFRYRAFIKDGKAKAMGYKTNAAAEYQDTFCEYVRGEAVRQGWAMSTNEYQHYYVDAIFYFPRTDKDPNNYWKLLLDAITQSGVVWKDDNVTCERVKKICYDSENPRIEIEIYPVEYIGVFDNAEELNSFELCCAGCKRYSRNCSILRRAKEGRVQAEVNDGRCAAFTKKAEKKPKTKRKRRKGEFHEQQN